MLAKFCNSAVVPFFINYDKIDTWYDKDGLVENMFFIMVGMTIVDPVL